MVVGATVKSAGAGASLVPSSVVTVTTTRRPAASTNTTGAAATQAPLLLAVMVKRPGCSELTGGATLITGFVLVAVNGAVPSKMRMSDWPVPQTPLMGPVKVS